jgi:hypothetical protein
MRAPSEQELRRTLAWNAYSHFRRVYFPDVFYHRDSAMHKRLASLVDNVCSRPRASEGEHWVICGPRGSGKTADTLFGFPVYAGIVRRAKRCIFLGAEVHEQAEEHLATLADALEDATDLKEDFPFEIDRRVRNELVVVSHSRNPRQKTLRIKYKPFGIGDSARGRTGKQMARPDLCCGDDFESLKSVRSGTLLKVSKTWFHQTWLNLGNKFTDYLTVGTLLSADSLLAELLQNPTFSTILFRAIDLDREEFQAWYDQVYWKVWRKKLNNRKLTKVQRARAAQLFYEGHKDAMHRTKGGRYVESLWSDAEPITWLLQGLERSGEVMFFSEKQGDPIALKDCKLKEAWFVWVPRREIIEAAQGAPNEVTLWASIDPSMGGSDKASESSITVVLREPTGVCTTVVSDSAIRGPTDLIDDAIKWHTRAGQYVGLPHLRPSQWFIESTAFQLFFKQQLEERARKEGGILLPCHPMYPHSDKIQRILITLEPIIRNGLLQFLDKGLGVLPNQMKYFPQIKKMDAIDGLQMCIQGINEVCAGTAPVHHVHTTPVEDILETLGIQ